MFVVFEKSDFSLPAGKEHSHHNYFGELSKHWLSSNYLLDNPITNNFLIFLNKKTAVSYLLTV